MFNNNKEMALSGEASVESCIHRFHVYQEVWNPVMDETLLCHREIDNSEDMLFINLKKSLALKDFTSVLKMRWNTARYYYRSSKIFQRLRERRHGNSM